MVVAGEAPPDLPGIVLDGSSIPGRYPEILQTDSLRVEHPEDVVVWSDEQCRRFFERLIEGEQIRGHVPVRADQRKMLNGLKQGPCNLAHLRIRIKESIWMQVGSVGFHG